MTSRTPSPSDTRLDPVIDYPPATHDGRRIPRPRQPRRAVPGPVALARWSAEHRGTAIAAWVVFVALCVGSGMLVGTREQADEDAAVGEWGRAEQIVAAGDFDNPVIEQALVTSRSGSLDQTVAAAAAEQVRAGWAALDEVSAGDPAPVVAGSPDGEALLVRAEISGDRETATERLAPLRAVIAAAAADHPDLRVEQVGGASFDEALSGLYDDDFARAELLSVPVALVVLLVAFGALLAAGVPVLLALSSVVAALGLSSLTSWLVPLSETTASVVLLIGMAVGVDYSLFYLRRAREERARGRSVLDAVEIAAATSGRAVVVSGVTVAISMAGMFLSGNALFSSIALGTILVVVIAVVGSVTVLPATLMVLGRWVDRPRIPLLHRLSDSSRPPRLWPALLAPVLRRPAVALAVGAAAMLLLAAPALQMRTALSGTADLPQDIPVVQAYERLIAAFPASGTSHELSVRAPADGADAVRASLVALHKDLSTRPGFVAVDEPELSTSDDGTVAVLSVPVVGEAGSPEAEASLVTLRDTVTTTGLADIAGEEHAVGGETAASVDFSAQIGERLPWVIVFVLALTFVVMVVTFRSVVVAATAIALNLLSVGAAYGLLVLVFQQTWAEGLLGFTSSGSIVSWLPMFLFVVLFGLSMDYHVFVVSRIREAAQRGLPTPDAVREGITGSAGAVTNAAAVMVAVFAIFGTLSVLEFKQLGVGLAAAVLIDATIVRAVLLPAVMTVLGRWNWCLPAALDRRLPNAAHRAA